MKFDDKILSNQNNQTFIVVGIIMCSELNSFVYIIL